MDFDLTLQMVFYHLEICLLAALIAIIVGGGLGYLLSFLLRDWVRRLPGFWNVLVIFPWRSISTWIALVLSRSGLMIIQFGLGFPADAFTIGGVLLVFVIPWVVQTKLGSYFPLNGLGKMVSFGRTLVILSIALEVMIHFGLGNFMDQAYGQLDYQKINQGYAVLGIMMVGLDLLLGFGQVMVARIKPAN